jgi:DNA-directed RNA polymerase sigma subunit (sigma70/sigma32)
MADNQERMFAQTKVSHSINSANKRSRKATATAPSKQMTKILASLSPREEMLFGIGSEAKYTLSELSRRFSLPPQRIRRIQLDAFTKLRQGSRYFLSQT